MPKPTIEEVRLFVQANKAFFETPLNDQDKFRKFFEDNDEISAIADYSTKFLNVLNKVMHQSGAYKAPVWVFWKNGDYEKALEHQEVRDFIMENANHRALKAWQGTYPPSELSKTNPSALVPPLDVQAKEEEIKKLKQQLIEANTKQIESLVVERDKKKVELLQILRKTNTESNLEVKNKLTKLADLLEQSIKKSDDQIQQKRARLTTLLQETTRPNKPKAAVQNEITTIQVERSRDHQSISNDYTRKFNQESWYKKPESVGNKTILEFPSEKKAVSFFHEQAEKGRRCVLINPKTDQVIAYCDGTGKLRHPNSKEFQKNDNFSEGISQEEFADSVKPKAEEPVKPKTEEPYLDSKGVPLNVGSYEHDLRKKIDELRREISGVEKSDEPEPDGNSFRL